MDIKRWQAPVVFFLLMFWGTLAIAQGNSRSVQFGVRGHVGTTLAFQPYYWFGGGAVCGVEGLASWPKWPQWDLELGVGVLHGTIAFPMWRANSGISHSAVVIPVSLSWRRWGRSRGVGWHCHVGWMLGVQVWGYEWENDPSGSRRRVRIPVGYVLDIEREGIKLAPIVPSIFLGAGYRYRTLPIEIGVRLGRDLLLRLEPYSKYPYFSLFAASYVGGTVAWWF